MNKWLVCFILLIGSVSVNAKGGCNKNSLDGGWKVFMTTVSDSSFSWKRCTLAIDKTGAVDPSSVCISNDGEEVAVDSGVLNTEKSCAFTGEIVLGEDTLEVVEGQLTGNKKAMAGVGLITGTSEGLFIFNGIQAKEEK